jgi:hypothetical protein
VAVNAGQEMENAGVENTYSAWPLVAAILPRFDAAEVRIDACGGWFHDLAAESVQAFLSFANPYGRTYDSKFERGSSDWLPWKAGAGRHDA